ncbi:hypothetical protein Patl1_26111 [Pistacia atlantica]|uniref:Uncharacterized protein n=1 Tax=Pistacia atlantica TaxID=434234 RepID=A0ACC1B0R4_9ROSI|nr:hypothetical protein Patl1_26111 [Pistacia atlantica]
MHRLLIMERVHLKRLALLLMAGSLWFPLKSTFCLSYPVLYP